jgi:hypothetical protein
MSRTARTCRSPQSSSVRRDDTVTAIRPVVERHLTPADLVVFDSSASKPDTS